MGNWADNNPEKWTYKMFHVHDCASMGEGVFVEQIHSA